MSTKKSRLESLTGEQIKRITNSVEKRRDIPLVTSRQVNMRLDAEILEKVMKLAKAQGLPYTTFLARLLREDIDRLWQVYKKTG